MPRLSSETSSPPPAGRGRSLARVRLAAACGVLGISFSAIFVRLADVAPDTAAFFRAAYALPVLYLLRRLLGGPERRPPHLRRWAFLAGLLLGADLAFWHRAIHDIGAGLATVLGNTQVVFVGLAAWLIHRERPSRAALLGVPVVFAGVTLISGLGRPDAYGLDPVRGALLGVATAITYTAFLLLFRASNRALGSPAGPLFDATLGTAMAAAVIGLAGGDLDLVPAWPAHGWLLALALVSQVFGWLLIADALPRVPALETSILLLLQPLATVLWGALIFGERLSPLQGVGMALVLAGVGWLSVRGSVERSPEPEKRPAPGGVGAGGGTAP